MGCNFCTTSAFFGGKGRFVNFFESGDELFEVMNRMEAELELHHHTPDNIMAEIEHAVSHDTDFHQFMLYTSVPGTPLYQQMAGEGRLLRSVDYADVHGQFKFNFKHAAISRDDSKRFLDWAFWRDFQLNGPSLYRISRTLMAA
jgi:hypothetical protein